ncbi:uncharacterized protein HKW66_Vig0104110 [Vigna angularis]|uniref:Uncharacterized protein n=1 Tax=Phaseolus angularis TaxID=3914 RepID=A0A8T0KJ54_PHAAN|nr:uncharacterized protein HKW66_Vig0104110 [Vigna angularis]
MELVLSGDAPCVISKDGSGMDNGPNVAIWDYGHVVFFERVYLDRASRNTRLSGPRLPPLIPVDREERRLQFRSCVVGAYLEKESDGPEQRQARNGACGFGCFQDPDGVAPPSSGSDL